MTDKMMVPSRLVTSEGTSRISSADVVRWIAIVPAASFASVAIVVLGFVTLPVSHTLLEPLLGGIAAVIWSLITMALAPTRKFGTVVASYFLGASLAWALLGARNLWPYGKWDSWTVTISLGAIGVYLAGRCVGVRRLKGLLASSGLAALVAAAAFGVSYQHARQVGYAGNRGYLWFNYESAGLAPVRWLWEPGSDYRRIWVWADRETAWLETIAAYPEVGFEWDVGSGPGVACGYIQESATAQSFVERLIRADEVRRIRDRTMVPVPPIDLSSWSIVLFEKDCRDE